MKIAQFRSIEHGVMKVFAEDDLMCTLPMYARISEWIEVEFPKLPVTDYLPKQIHALDQQEQELREKLGRLAMIRASLQDGPTERERIEMCGPDPVRNSELGL